MTKYDKETLNQLKDLAQDKSITHLKSMVKEFDMQLDIQREALSKALTRIKVLEDARERQKLLNNGYSKHIISSKNPVKVPKLSFLERLFNK